MAVDTAGHLVTAVNALPTSKQGNSYAASLGTSFPNGKTQVVVQKNGAAFLTVTHQGAQAGIGRGTVAITDSNPNGQSVEYVDPANPSCLHIVPADQFLLMLVAN